MIVGMVIGMVVCTQKDPSLIGKKMLVIQPVNICSLKNEGSPVIALDAVGAGEGELVMVVGGSSARLAEGYAKVAVDQAVIGILDSISVNRAVVFRKEGVGDS
ncbi:MAG: EutN/CcmL family microcompartment protein [Clostridiales bacterium]|nr:EutN/CcmL family microcompartment protein [Clostridiales bacterium]